MFINLTCSESRTSQNKLIKIKWIYEKYTVMYKHYVYELVGCVSQA